MSLMIGSKFQRDLSGLKEKSFFGGVGSRKLPQRGLEFSGMLPYKMK